MIEGGEEGGRVVQVMRVRVQLRAGRAPVDRSVDSHAVRVHEGIGAVGCDLQCGDTFGDGGGQGLPGAEQRTRLVAAGPNELSRRRHKYLWSRR